MQSLRKKSTEHISNSPRFLFYAFLVLLAWLPLPMASNRPWAWSIMELYVFVLAIIWLILFAIGRTDPTKAFLKAKPVILLFALWILFVFIQFTPMPFHWVEFFSSKAAFLYQSVPGINHDYIPISVDPHATKIAWQKSIAYVLFFSLTLLLVDRRNRIKILCLVIIFSGFAQAIYGSIMSLSGLEYGFFIEKEVNRGVATGTFINRNHLANFLVMSLAVGIGWMISKTEPSQGEKSKKQRLRAIIHWVLSGKISMRLVLAAMVVGLILTHSRMGNSAFFLSLMFAGGLMWHFSKGNKLNILALFVSLIIIDLIIMGNWFGIDKVADRIQQTTVATESRSDVFEYAWMLWLDYFWVGCGLETFYTTFPAYRGGDVVGYFDHAHNDYLELLGDVGIVGFFLLSSVVIWSFLIGIQAMKNNRSRTMRGIAFASIMTITAQLIHATVDFSLRIPANTAYFMVILAMAWIASVSFGQKISKNNLQ